VDDEIQLRAPGENPREIYSNQRRNELVAKAIRDLPEEQRWVIVLRFYEGFSYEEISQTLHVAVGTVKSRLYRAKEALRAILGNGKARPEDAVALKKR
jgi:RNA polymerase sigma-70 factor (ECF subfamily)